MALTLIGVNHKTAPVDLREKLSIPKGGESEVLDSLRESSRLRGASLISTCNRVEVLTSSEDENVIEPVVEMLAERADIDQDDIEKHLYILRHRDVIRHMFRLASGLESMIVGEPQIAGQVKDSYQIAKDHQTLDTTLFNLYEQTLHVAKRVREQQDALLGTVGIDEMDRVELGILLLHVVVVCAQAHQTRIFLAGLEILAQRVWKDPFPQ